METKPSHDRMSKVILEYASDYIGMGTSLHQRQVYLESAILAWNLSLFSEEEREQQMDASLRKLEAFNWDFKNLEILKQNLAMLIEKKLTEFPEIKKLIVNAQINIVEGKEYLHVVSTDFQESSRQY